MEIRDLIVMYDDEPMVGTWTIAQGFDRDHKRVVELIEKYKENFLRLKRKKSITTRKLKSTGGRPIVEYLLNEQQTAFLGTLFRNNELVVLFKEKLIKEFYRMKEALIKLNIEQSDPAYLETRTASKVKRLETTTVMKEFEIYATKQGSQNANYYYMAITRMANAALFIVRGKFKNLRDIMTSKQLMVIGAAEGIIDKTLRDNMKKGIYYKDIYKLVKERILLFADLHGQSEVMLKCLEEE